MAASNVHRKTIIISNKVPSKMDVYLKTVNRVIRQVFQIKLQKVQNTANQQ